MKTIRLRVQPEEAADLADDLTAWAAATGVDPVPAEEAESGSKAEGAAVVYLVYASGSFFEQFPRWRICIEQ